MIFYSSERCYLALNSAEIFGVCSKSYKLKIQTIHGKKYKK